MTQGGSDCVLVLIQILLWVIIVQGGHRALKVLEKNAHFSRAWKVLENGIGP